MARTLGALEAALQAAEKGGGAGMGGVAIGIDKSELGVFDPPRVRWAPSAESVAKSAAWNVAKLATGQIDEAAAVAAAIAAGPLPSKTPETGCGAGLAADVVAVEAALVGAAAVDAELDGAVGDSNELSRVEMPAKGSAALDSMHEALSRAARSGLLGV